MTMDNPSLYAERASTEISSALAGVTRADVVVIGAGITGCSAALHLAESGRDVVVLDTHEVGWGASGRNGGQVNPGLKMPPEQVVRDFGEERGARLVEAAWGAPDLVFELIGRHGIACEAVRGGTIRAATAMGQLGALWDLTGQCETRGGAVAWLDEAAMAARTGTRVYVGGMIDARGGQVDPLAYTRGLARAAVRAGARFFGGTRVRSVVRDGGMWRVGGEAGEVIARSVVVATNGYSGPLWEGLRRSVIPVFSAVVASAPLPSDVRGRILAGREVLYELGEITTYYRIDAAGRLLMGGRSASRALRGVEAFPYLVRRAEGLWPDLHGMAWTHGWNGQLALTLDHYPHWHQPAAGLLGCVGYNGRGVAMATVLGRDIARVLAGAEPLFPVTGVRPVRLHFGWRAGVAAGIAWGRVKDRLAR